jgi:hypothetical protein
MFTIVQQRPANATTIRRASVIDSIELGRLYPLLRIDIINLETKAVVLLTLQIRDGHTSDIVLPRDCYHLFTLKDIVNIQEGRMHAHVMYTGICDETGASLLQVIR